MLRLSIGLLVVLLAIQTNAFCCFDCAGVCKHDPTVTNQCNSSAMGCDSHHCAPWCGSNASDACDGFQKNENCSAFDGSKSILNEICCWNDVECITNFTVCTPEAMGCDPRHDAPWCGLASTRACTSIDKAQHPIDCSLPVP